MPPVSCEPGVTTRTSSSRRPPLAPASSASPSPAGRFANSPPTCGKCTDVSSASAVKPYGAFSGAAASSSSAPRPGRSHPTLIATPSSTGSSRCWNAFRTGSSPSTSSGPWGSGPPQAPAGRSRASQTGCRRPTAAPGRAQVDPRRPTRRRPDLHHPGQPLRPHRRGHPPLGEEEQGRAVLHPDLRFLGQPDRGPPRPAAAVHPGQLPPPQPPRANPGTAPLPALAQHQRPPPRRTRRPTQGTRPHPQRKGHPLGRTPLQHRSLTNREPQLPNAEGASSGVGQRQKDDSGGGRLDLPRKDDDLVDEAPPQMDDVRSRQAGASIRRGEDPLVPRPFVRHVHR